MGREMKLRRHTDYALRVLIYVAETTERRCSVPEIAAAHRISENHLVKIVHKLGKFGFLDTARGRGGGLSLPAAPETISLADVIRSLEGDDCVVDCSTCILAGRCPLPGPLDQAKNAFYDALRGLTLADLAAQPRPR